MNTQSNGVMLVTLHSIPDDVRGVLSVAEYGRHIPFEIKRIFYLYDLPKGIIRGKHAHRTQEQFIICLNGCVEISTEYGRKKNNIVLSEPGRGLYCPPMTWMTLTMVQKGTICLVLASDLYDEADYIRNYDVYKASV